VCSPVPIGEAGMKNPPIAFHTEAAKMAPHSWAAC
jgi:hypothetical protein